MARRVIATAEVQVAADVGQAEAGLEGLTSAFRQIGSQAERAAQRMEAAFFDGATSATAGFKKLVLASEELLDQMRQTDARARKLAEGFEPAIAAAKRLARTDMNAAAVEMLYNVEQIAGALGLVEAGYHDAARAAERARRETQEIENATLEAEYRAYRLGEAFRDVGQDIEIAMAGGLDALQDEIVRTIRRLSDMGDKGFDVARILERSFDGILDQFENDAAGARTALLRLQQVGDSALDALESDARQAAAALNQTASAANQTAAAVNRADRSIDGMSNVVRRTSGDVRGLVGLLGAAGLGYAAASAARAGLDMTIQLEKSEAMFLGLTGSVEGAADMLERMVIFARETPYNLANVSDAAAQLLAVGDGFGVTTANIESYLTSIGNAITMTGGGEENFTRLVRVFGQMSSSGKVLGQDMNQLAQNLPGYDVWQTLADGAGTSVAELRKLQDLGKLDELLTGNKAVQILIDGMETIPGAAGAMERRMQTLGGAIEKFRETAQFAISEGLQPFAETAQDTLSDPVILNSVEDLSNAFGDLLSTGLEALAPELDDLAAAGQNLIEAFDSWAPVLASIVDGVGDVINVVSALVGPLGTALSAVLNFGDGLGKMGLAAAAFAAGGPVGIAAGVVLGVSGAMDAFGGSAEQAAELTRLFAAAQEDVNAAMAVGDEAVFSEAQQLAIDTATELRDLYPDLVQQMTTYGVSLNELQAGLSVLATGTGQLTPKMEELFSTYAASDDHAIALMRLVGTHKEATETIGEEATKQQEVLAIAGVEEIAALEERQAAMEAYGVALREFGDGYAEFYRTMIDDQAEANEEWGELDEERTETLRGILQDQADAYIDWAADIDDSTSGAAISLADVAEEADNSARKMIDAINQHTTDTIAWKDNIVNSAAVLADVYDVPQDAAQEFMGVLGEMGPESAPALQAMLDNFLAGGGELKEFFDAVTANSEAMNSSLTEDFDELTGTAPGFAESLAEGTLTVEELLAEIPAAMEAAGVDFETAASQIDASDEMGTVGTEAVNGLVNALNSPAAQARVRAAANRLANSVEQGTSVPLGVSSPSRVMYEIGEFVVEGLVGGIQSMDDEAYAAAVQTASMLTGGIAWHFINAEDPQEEARKFAKDIADTIIDELIAEQEAVADAAEALADAAADRLSEAWDRVRDRFKTRDIQEAITDAQAELSEARAELASAESLAGAGGTQALAAAQSRVAAAEAALAAAEAADTEADRLADQTLEAFQRATEDATAELQRQQEAETTAIQARIDAAKRNLDPVARAAAEAELAAAKIRQQAEMTAFERQREDEEELLQLRLDNENDIREAAVKAKEDELKAFEDALDDVVDSIQDAIENLPDLRQDITDAERGLQGAFFDQFESLLENVGSVDRNLLASIGAASGLTATEVNDLIDAALASESAAAGAAAANLGIDQLVDLLSTGLYTIGADGALGIAAGLSSQARAIADAMYWSVQAAINNTLASLDISSPSGVTEKLIGEPMAEGIAAGIMSASGAISSAMTGLLDNVISEAGVPTASQLVNDVGGDTAAASLYRGPLVTMPGAVIQDATDADLVAQRVLVALSATGVDA